MGAYSWNDHFNSETTACAESTIADLYNRVGDGCAVRLRTNSLSRLAYPRMPQRLLRKAGTAPHSGRIQRLQHMADDAVYRLAHRDAYNASFAARKTQKVKGGSNRPRSRVKCQIERDASRGNTSHRRICCKAQNHSVVASLRD